MMDDARILGEILNASPDLVATATADLRLTYLNEAGRAMLGWAPEVDLLQKTVHDLHPAWAVRIITGEGMREAERQGTWSGETALLAADGSEIPVAQRIIAHFSDHRDVQYFSTVARDISVEKALQRENETRARALESSVTATAIATPDGTLTYVNPAFLDLWGEESKDDVLGKNAVSFWVDPEAAFAVMSAIASDDHWIGELEGSRTDGAQFTAWLSAGVTRNPSGELESLLATFVDISERVATERALHDSRQRFSAVIEHNRSFVWEIDVTGLYTYASDSCYLVTGYAAEELVGKLHYYDLHPAAGREEFKNETLAIIRRGESFERYENALLRKDGTEHWLSTSGKTVVDENGGVYGYRGVDSDITEERSARERLRRSETLLADAERVAHTGSWEQDLLTGEVVWSKELCRILQMEPDRDEPSPAAFIERVHPQDRIDLEEMFAQAAAGRTAFEARFRLLLPNATVKHVETAGAFAYDETGSPVRAVGFLRDVTELVSVQRDLNLRIDAMEKSITGMTITDSDGTLAYVNQAFVDMWGARTREEVAGKHAAAFHEYPEEASEIIGHLLAEDTYGGEFVAKRFDGTTFPVLYGANVVRAANGEIEYLMGTFIDVTERKRAVAEARQLADRFRQHLDATRSGYWLVDSETRLLDVNRSACDMLGYTREEMLGMRVNDIDVPETPEETRQRIARLLENGYDKYETSHRKKDGTIVDVEISVTLLTTEEEPGLLAFIDDISEQKRIETLEREREIAVRSNQAKDAFLGSVTHELKTPLNIVMGHAQLLQGDHTLSEAHADSVREISESGRLLLTLIDNVIDFTMIDSGHLDLVTESVDCESIVHEAAQAVAAAAADRGMLLRYGSPRGPRLRARADYKRLKQVLLNLLSNAIAYNRPDGSIDITVRRTEAKVRIAVRDTGVGIPAQKHGDVFTTFARLGREALSIPGTGLGLAYSKRLVELMGGTVDFESTEGAGSTFWVELPEDAE